MQVKLEKNSLLIVAETDFEAQWMSQFIHHGNSVKAFLKCGLTATDIIGIKLFSDKSAINKETKNESE